MLILKKMVSTAGICNSRYSGRAHSPSFKEWAHDGEDFFIDNPSLGLKIICDGVGGAQSSDSARLSKYVAEFFEDQINTLIKSGSSIDQEVLKTVFKLLLTDLQQNKFFREGSTTLTVTVKSRNKLYGLAVGDSPVKVFRKNPEGALNNVFTSPGTLSLVYTKNQPMPGQITGPGEYIGKPQGFDGPKPVPALFEYDLEPGDIILQTSDGISDNISDEEISEILNPSSSSAMLDEGQVKSEIIAKLTEKYDQGPSRQRPSSPWIKSQTEWAKEQLKSIKYKFRYVDMNPANGKSLYIIQFFNQFKLPNVHHSHKERMGKLDEFFTNKFRLFYSKYRNEVSAMKGVLNGFMENPQSSASYRNELREEGLENEYNHLHKCLHQKKDELTYNMFLRSDCYPNSGKQVFQDIAGVLCPKRKASEKSVFIRRFLLGELDDMIYRQWTRTDSSTPTMKKDDATVIVEQCKSPSDVHQGRGRRTSSSDGPDSGNGTGSDTDRSRSASEDSIDPPHFIGPSDGKHPGLASPQARSPQKVKSDKVVLDHNGHTLTGNDNPNKARKLDLGSNSSA